MSTYVTRANIFIGGIKINKYKSIKVEKTLDGSKATIVFNDNLQIDDRYLYRAGSDNNPLGKGQYIYIDMGWDDLKSDEFTAKQKNTHFDAIRPTNDDLPHFIGFISNIKQNFQSRELTVECEDYSYLLKKVRFDFSEKEISLKALGEKIVAELPRLDISMNISDDDFIWAEFNECEVKTGIDFTLKKYVAEKATGYDILTHLADEFNIRCLWIGETLVMGVNYLNPDLGYEKEFTFTQIPRAQHNKDASNMLYALDTGGLEWQNSKDISLKITANVVDKTLEKKTFELGDEFGSEREFWYYGDYKEADVKKLIEIELSRLKYDGFKEGSKITSFGRMTADYRDRGASVLDTIILDGIDYKKELDGMQTVLPSSAYLCNGVTYTMDSNGFMAEIELGQLFPTKVESQYEKTDTESFNENNLDYTATYTKFDGVTTFNAGTGETSFEKTEPVSEPIKKVEDSSLVKGLKNEIFKYKSALSMLKDGLTEQTNILRQLGYDGGDGYWTNPDLSAKFIELPLASYINIIYRGRERETLGQPIEGYNYNPPNLVGMKLTNVINIVEGDAENISLFNNYSIELEKILNMLISVWYTFRIFQAKVSNDDLSKLTEEERYIFDTVLQYGQETRAVSILSIV